MTGSPQPETRPTSPPDPPLAADARADAAAPPLRALQLLFLASGAAGLVYQVMWTREFGLVFGSTSRAASVVLAAFFAGLALGNLLGGRAARDRSRALLLYALVELAIAAGGFGVLVWLDLYEAWYPALYRSGLGEGVALRGVQLLLALVAMAPPTMAMGATLPLIGQVAVTRRAHLGQRSAGLYAANTIGATLGVLLSGFWLPLWLGTRNAMALAMAVNLAVAAASLVLWRGLRRAGPVAPEPLPPSIESVPDPASRPIDAAVYLIVIASGFGTLALEVLHTRLIAHLSDGSVYSFALMLSIFLVALALGSALVAAVIDRLTSVWRLIAWSATLATLAILLAPRVFDLAAGSGPLAPQPSEPGYLGRLGLAAALTIGPGVALIGVTLPAAWRVAAREAGEAGRRIGSLTSANTLAGVAGSLCAGFVLLPRLGLSASFALTAGVFASLAAVAWWRAETGRRRVAGLALALALFALPLAAGSTRLSPVALRPGERVLWHHDGEGGSVAVTEWRGGVRALRINNRYSLATTDPGDVARQRNEGRLGLLLADEPRSVAFIGLATGISVSALREFPGVRRALAIELIPGVLEAARHFEQANLGVLDDPRLEIVLADARSHLHATDERFDVVIGDLFVPWHAGTGYLYTLEHFRSVGERLEPGGVFVQWLQGSIITLAEVRIIAASFADALPEVELWRVRDTGWLAFVGRRQPDRIGPLERARDPRLSEFEPLADGETLRAWTQRSPRNRDTHPIIEFRTAGSHLVQREDAVPRMHRALRRLQARWLDPSTGEPER